MLGSLIKATKIIDLASLELPIKNRFGLIAQKNVNAYTRAFSETVMIESDR
jgi:pyruvate ferredoxin oxidoreductase gamma subunit